jgi:hypothetical protein
VDYNESIGRRVAGTPPKGQAIISQKLRSYSKYSLALVVRDVVYSGWRRGQPGARSQIGKPGSGRGVWSWVHIAAAAAATVAALECTAGVYNIVDSDPSELSVCLPAFAAFVRAPAPPRLSEADTLQSAGPDWIYHSTRLRGAFHTKAKRELRFAPGKLEWLAKRSS